MRRWICVLVVVSATSCTTKKEEAKLTQPILARQEAIVRFNQVSNVVYDQEFFLDGLLLETVHRALKEQIESAENLKKL